MKRRKQELYEKVLALRKEGCSYNEIVKTLNVRKSTVCHWMRGVDLNEEAIERLMVRQKIGHIKSTISTRGRIFQRNDFIFKRVSNYLGSIPFTPDIAKLLC